MRILPNKTVDIRREMKQCPTCGQRFSRDAGFCPFDGERLGHAIVDATSDPLTGSTVEGRYQVLDLLGEGGMGRVYRVSHISLDRTFAMKVLRRDLARDEALAARFIHEAKATASVRHPNVVQITDFGTLGDAIPYFVMDLLVGRTLGEALKGGPVPARTTLRILEQMARGVGAAHEAGIVHRDLKPDNVFLVATGPPDGGAEEEDDVRVDVRVVDFGASKIVGSSRITRTGVVFGTPYYMSPEQANGQSVDQRSDVYALGVIMYEMLTGHLPFEADTYMGVLTQHMFAKPVPPSEVGIADADLGFLEAVTLKCLEKRPGDRFGSMDDLLASLASTARGEPLLRARNQAREDGIEGPPPHSSLLLPEASAHESLAPPPKRSWGWMAVAGVVVASAGLFLALRNPAAPATAPVRTAPAAAPVGVASVPAPAVEAIPAADPPPAPAAPASAAPSAPAAVPARPQHRATRSHLGSPARVQTGLDDVGDPFATHR